jgi:carboxymethylenebutenolidase
MNEEPGAVFDAHVRAEFVECSVDVTMATMMIDELIISFTHDVEMPALLPGVAPTGRKVILPHVVLMGIVDGKVAYEHIYWDQASLLVQVGLLDPATLPVVGAEQAAKLRDPTLPSNELIYRAARRTD